MLSNGFAWSSVIPWICGAFGVILAIQLGHAPLLFLGSCLVAFAVSWAVTPNS